MCLDILLGAGYGLLHGQSVEGQRLAIVAHGLLAIGGGVHHDAFLGVIRLLRDVGTLDERHDRQAEMLGEGIVAAVVSRHGHDGTRAVAGQHVFRNPDGVLLAGEGVDGVGAGEDARHLMVYLTLALGAACNVLHVFLHLFLLLRRGELLHQLALRCQYHERHAEHRVGTGGEDGE